MRWKRRQILRLLLEPLDQATPETITLDAVHIRQQILASAEAASAVFLPLEIE